MIGYYLDFLSEMDGYDLLTASQDYIIALKAKSVSDTTIYTYVKHIKVFLRYAYRNKVLEEDLTEKLAVRLPKTMPEILTKAEIERLIYKSSKRDQIIFMLALDAGLRKKEICQLQVKDLTKDYIFISAAKGNKDRIVPISPGVYERAIHYIKHRKFRSDYVVLGDTGDPLSLDGLHCVFTRAKKRCDIPRISAHLLRHTYATYFVYNGGDSAVLALILGHSTLKVTEKYIHLAGLIDLQRYTKYSPLHDM